MTNFIALPLALMLAVAAAGGNVADRLRPAAAARFSAVLMAAVAIAAVPTLWLIGLSGLGHAGLHNPITDWCRHLLPEYAPLGGIVGIGSLVVAVVGTVRVALVLAHHRRVRCTETCPVEFVSTDEVYAYTLPGPARTIVISDGLRNTLDTPEFELVLAHERAHAGHRHDRFKLLALLVTAFVPTLGPLARRLDYHLERWADEDAIDDTGVDRELAARTIAKVALANTSPIPALGVADHSTAARATALLAPPERPALSAFIWAASLLATTLTLSAFQLHHSAHFAFELVH